MPASITLDSPLSPHSPNKSQLVYIFLLVPILFLGIGSSAPGVISVFIVLFSNLLDGRQKERKITHEAARFLTGYLLGE